jgi:hypothetical protein
MLALPLVTYTASGASGGYDLNFTVENNVAPNHYLYIWGLSLPGAIITGTPDPWSAFPPIQASAESLGGSTTIYTTFWQDGFLHAFPSGTSLSGFSVHITDAVLPTSIAFIASTLGTEPYLGDDHLVTDLNPLFEGTATLAANVPDGGSSVLFVGAGLVGLIALRRRGRV